MGTESLIPVYEVPLPATLPVGQTQSASENKKVFVVKGLSIARSGRELNQSWTPAMVGKGSLHQPGSDKRRGPELPRSPGGPADERLASSPNPQGPQGERKSWEGEEVPGLLSQPTKILTATQGTCSPRSHVTACQSLQGMSASHTSETSDRKGGMLNSERGLLVQAPGLPALSFASEEMTSKPRGPSNGDRAASQVLCVCLPTLGVNMELQQGPWVPAHVSGTCQNKECPPAARGATPLATEAEKPGGWGVVSLGPFQTREKRLCSGQGCRGSSGTHLLPSSVP